MQVQTDNVQHFFGRDTYYSYPQEQPHPILYLQYHQVELALLIVLTVLPGLLASGTVAMCVMRLLGEAYACAVYRVGTGAHLPGELYAGRAQNRVIQVRHTNDIGGLPIRH